MLRRLYYQHRHRDSQFAELFSPYRGNEAVALDLETTSLNTQQAEIVSIGAVKIRGKRILTSQALDLKVSGAQSLNGDSIKVHRLRHQDLTQGLPLKKALQQLLSFVGNRPIVGYNIAYDLRILNRYCLQEHGFKLVNPLLDVGKIFASKVHVAHVGIAPNQDLQHICSSLNVPLSGRHQAIDDAITAAMLYLRLEHGPSPDHALPQDLAKTS